VQPFLSGFSTSELAKTTDIKQSYDISTTKSAAELYTAKTVVFIYGPYMGQLFYVVVCKSERFFSSKKSKILLSFLWPIRKCRLKTKVNDLAFSENNNFQMCFQMCLLYDPHALPRLPVRVYQAELKSLQNVLQKPVVSSRKELLFEKYQNKHWSATRNFRKASMLNCDVSLSVSKPDDKVTIEIVTTVTAWIQLF